LLGVNPLVSDQVVAPAPAVAIREKAPPERERSIWNPVSLPELSCHARSIRPREIAVAVSTDGAAGIAPGVGVGVLVGVAVGGTGVGVRVGVAVGTTGVGVHVGVAVGTTGVEVRVGVRVAVGGMGVAVGGGGAPFRIVNESSIAPVSRRNFASRRFSPPVVLLVTM